MTVEDLVRLLPEIGVLRGRCRALAVLDAVMSPEWESRYYSFDSHWAPDEQMASMRDGTGDAWSVVFSPAGAFLRGFAHESPMNPARRHGRLWPGLVGGVPAALSAHVHEPAFASGDTLDATVCAWRQHDDDQWHSGPVDLPGGEDPDGADRLFEVLTGPTPVVYRRLAQARHGTAADLRAVGEVLALRPLSDGLVRRLNPRTSLADLADDLAEIGHPLHGAR